MAWEGPSAAERDRLDRMKPQVSAVIGSEGIGSDG